MAKKASKRRAPSTRAPKRTTRAAVKPKAARPAAAKERRSPASAAQAGIRQLAPQTLSMTARTRIYNLTKEIPEQHYFVLANGRPVKHVAELASVLDQLEDHVFKHHVTSERNDFATWVKDIFQDVELARKITGVGDKKHLQLVIYRHLAGHDK